MNLSDKASVGSYKYTDVHTWYVHGETHLFRQYILQANAFVFKENPTPVG